VKNVYFGVIGVDSINTTNMKTKIIFIFLILGIIKTSAQSDFRSGYIVTNNNDTLYGLIDYKGSSANKHECLFKENKKAKQQKYTPDEIAAYRFTDSKYYVSRLINTGEKEEPVFLEYLINGIVNIYSYRDLNGEHYFIEKDKGKIVNLKEESKEVIVGLTSYLKETKEYRGVLKYLLKDSPTISSEIDQTNLNHKSLIKLASDYHTQMCSDRSCIIYERKPTKIKFEFGPLIGYNVESLAASNKTFNQYYYFKNSKFTTACFPAFGFFAKANIPFINERLFVQYEGTFSNYSSGSVAPVNVYDNIYEEFTIKRQAYHQTFMFRYEFSTGKIRPVLQLGLFENTYRNDSYCTESLHFNDGSTSVNDVKSLYPSTITDYGLSLGAGFSTKILNRNAYVDVRYQPNISYDRGMYGLLPNLNSTTFLMNLSMSILKSKVH
jgi:hypothetical protein